MKLVRNISINCQQLSSFQMNRSRHKVYKINGHYLLFFIIFNDHSTGALQLYCTSLLHSIFTPLARAYGHVHVRNVRDFPQTKLDGEINYTFLLHEHSDPRFFRHVFPKNS